MANLPEKEPESSGERYPVVERRGEPEIPPELLRDGYMERVEEVELHTPVTDDQGRILVTSPAAQKVNIVLPLGRSAYLNPKNWHRPVTEAIRWLLAWTKRVIKMNPKRTTFNK